MNIEIVSGSPRKDSVSFRLALHLLKYFTQNTTHTTGIIDVRGWPISTLQEQVFTTIEHTPDQYKPLAERMFAANAFIFVSPEYNGSYTAVLKNLFDHFPKQTHKAFGIVTASPGALGGVRAALQLQLFINAIFGIQSPYMLVTPFVDQKFDAEGNLLDAKFQPAVDLFVKEFRWLAEKMHPEVI